MRFLLLLASIGALYGQPQAQPLLASFAGAGGGSGINGTPVQHTLSAHNVTSQAFGSSVTAGNLITVVVNIDNSALNTVLSIADTQSNSFVRAVSQVSTFYTVELWYAKNITGGSDTVTITTASTFSGYIYIQEWHGASLTAPLDASASSNGGNPSVTTGLANELLLAGTANGSAAPTCTGYTAIDTNANVNGGGALSKVAGTAGSYNAVCTSGFDVTVLAAFK